MPCRTIKATAAMRTLKTIRHSVPFLLCLLYAERVVAVKEPADTIAASLTNAGVKEEKGRNVMLNASDANKPREIQIGLPSEDVNVYENGLPAVYSSTIHKLATHWRSDASLGHVGLMTPSESAITTGNIAYSVNAYSQLGSKDFKGVVNYKANHFGMQNFDGNVSGSMGRNLLFTASVYQNFDPGFFDPKFTNYSDRTQLYHAGLTWLFGQGRGKTSLLYKYSRSAALGTMVTYAPFIYVGDGSVREVPGFRLGTDSYCPESGYFTYMDVRDGVVKKQRIGDGIGNSAHEIAWMTDYTFSARTRLTLNMKYMGADASYVDFSGSNIMEAGAADGYLLDGKPYAGLTEARIAFLHYAKVRNILLTSELSHRAGNHDLRLGLNQWNYFLDYHSSSTKWNCTVEPYPSVLSTVATAAHDGFYEFNAIGSEYTKGHENKLALYFTDDWQVTPRLNLYYGGRVEYYRMDLDQIPLSRYDGFHIGAVNHEGKRVEPVHVTKDKINYAATLQLKFNLNRHAGIQADGTVATRFPRINEYAGTGPTAEQYKRVVIPLIRGGVSYRNDWIDASSMVTFISKSNNIDQQNVTKPGTQEMKTVLLIYNIQTLGWTTTAEIDPFKRFHLHALFTWQKPVYKNYFIKSPFEGVPDLDADGNIVKEIPQMLVELDPSYDITDRLRVWLSFRYFGKTYANLTDALYFNGRWETFGGIDWKVNKFLSVNVNVINILNQKGASGTISGAELLSKEEASEYANHYMSGNYLRPFTVEFGAKINF